MSHIDDGALHAYLDGALDEYPATEAARIRRHLDGCADCAERLEQERRVRSDAHGILDLAAPRVEAPSFEELRAYVERTRTRSGALSRLHRLGWAASVVVALGVGWFLRDGQVQDVGRLFDATATVEAPAREAPAREVPARAPATSPSSDATPTDATPTDATGADRTVERPTGSFARSAQPGAGMASSRAPATEEARQAETVAEVQATKADEAPSLVAELGAVGDESPTDRATFIDESEVAGRTGSLDEATAVDPAPASERVAALDQAVEVDAEPSAGVGAEGASAMEILVDAGERGRRVVVDAPVPASGAPEEAATDEDVTAGDLGVVTSARAVEARRAGGSAEASDDDPAETLAAVPGLEVLDVRNLVLDGRYVGGRVTQRRADGVVIEVVNLEPDVEPDEVLLPLPYGYAEARSRATDGWVVVRGPLPTDDLEVLLLRLFPEAP